MSTMHRPALGQRRRAFTALAAGCAAGDVPLSTVLPPAQCWHCNVTHGVGAQVLGFPGDRFAGVVPGSVEAAPGSVSGHPANPGSGRGRSGNPGADFVHPELPGSVPVRSGPFFALRWTRAEPAFRRWTDSEPGIPTAPPDGRKPNPGSHGRLRMDESRTRDRTGAPGWTKTEPGIAAVSRRSANRTRDRARAPGRSRPASGTAKGTPTARIRNPEATATSRWGDRTPSRLPATSAAGAHFSQNARIVHDI